MYFFEIVLKNLLRRKVRSILTVVGITVGIEAVVALVAISNGFVTNWTRMYESRGTDITVAKAGAIDIFTSIVDEKWLEDLKQLPGVSVVEGTIAEALSIEDKPAILVFGFKAGGYLVSRLNTIEGRAVSADTAGTEVMLGKIAAKTFKKKVGDEIEIEKELFKISGVYESGNIFEDGAVVMDLRKLQFLTNRKNQVTVFNIKLENIETAKATCKAIETMFPILDAMENKELTQTNQGVQMAKAMSWGTSLIALLVGAIGTMNTMLMSVFERTKELGILKAIGWRRKKILQLIMSESMCLSLTGGFLGIVFGVLTVKILTRIPMLQGFIYGDLTALLYVEAMGIALMLGLCGGLYPAIRASKLSPMEALRYE
jgi:putative ABC transport system permease protein